MLPAGYFEGLDPDEESVEGYMGNYGPTMDRQARGLAAGCAHENNRLPAGWSLGGRRRRAAPLLCLPSAGSGVTQLLLLLRANCRFYRRAALVIWPRARRFQILASANINAAVSGAGGR